MSGETVDRLEEAFDDPLVRQTEWSPLQRGGSNTRTRALKRPGPDRLVFRPAPWGFIFPSLFILGGAALAIDQPFEDMEPAWLQLVIALVLVVAGLRIGYGMTRPVVLDRQAGCCWLGWRAPVSVEAARSGKDAAALDAVRAVQVIRERITKSDGGKGYDSYEINLVLADGSRLHLVDHGKLAAIREDAATIGEFLGVPVWDASDFEFQWP